MKFQLFPQGLRSGAAPFTLYRLTDLIGNRNFPHYYADGTQLHFFISTDSISYYAPDQFPEWTVQILR